MNPIPVGALGASTYQFGTGLWDMKPNTQTTITTTDSTQYTFPTWTYGRSTSAGANWFTAPLIGTSNNLWTTTTTSTAGIGPFLFQPVDTLDFEYGL